jgi:hypothetical protein
MAAEAALRALALQIDCNREIRPFVLEELARLVAESIHTDSLPVEADRCSECPFAD